MIHNLLKTRRGRLRYKIQEELTKAQPEIDNIIDLIDKYEQSNLNTIEKLKRGKRLTIRRINGALKSTIHAHGPITRQYIGSASKRIYGGLLENPEPTWWGKIKNYFK